MRILVLSFYYEPDLCAGSFRATAFINALFEQLPDGSTIDVITTMPNRYNSFMNKALVYEKHEELSLYRVALPSHKSGMLDQSKAFYSYAKAVINRVKDKNYDAIYGTSSRLLTASLSAYIASQKKLPLYLDIRDIFVDTIRDVLPKKISWLMLPFFSLLEYWTINKANKVNLVSEGFKAYFDSRYPNQEFNFYPNGIDDEFVSSEINENHLISTPIRVVYAGNIGEGQGLHRILPSLAKSLESKVEFIVLGDGGRKAQLEEALGLNNVKNVHLLSPVSRKELIGHYKQADVLFLHLNDYDAFRKVLPSKLFEYGALGKPIWAGVSGYAAKFIATELDNAVLFEPCNEQQAVDSFNTLALKTKPREYFVNKFSRKQIMKEMAKDCVEVFSGNNN